jgi:GNAT superfamily N-acetyltransferase
MQALTISRTQPRYAVATQGFSKPITALTTAPRTGSEVGEVWNRLSETIQSVAQGHGLNANVSANAGQFSVGFQKEGKRVGSVSFSLDARSKSGYIDGFFMDRNFQGTGLGGNIINAVLKHAQAAGVEKIGLLANGGAGIGRYAWAIMGFDFRGYRADEGNLFKDFLKGKGVDPGEMTFKHSWEIAAFEHNGNKLGKDYLMGHHGSYDAVFNLTPGSKSLMAFQNFMARRKVSEAGEVIKAA